MSTPDVRETLRGIRFLHDIEEASLVEIARLAEVRDVPGGSVLFREGQPHPSIYLVAEGGVALEIRVAPQVSKRIQTIGPGEILGWSPLLGPGEMTATARTTRPTKLVAIPGAQLMALCEHDPRLGFELMRRLVRILAWRLNATRLQLLDVYNHELPAFAVGQEV